MAKFFQVLTGVFSGIPGPGFDIFKPLAVTGKACLYSLAIMYLRASIKYMGFSLRLFRKKTGLFKKQYRRFLTRLEKNTPRGLDKLTADADKEVWQEVDCLACANCCKTMTPTFTPGDIKRIAIHLGMTADEFKKKWLKKERGTGDWINKSTPCQFLNLKDNKCAIYEVRPVDCAGFPHLPKKRMTDYMHVHKQNIEFCPATFKMVEKIMEKLNAAPGK